MKLFKQTPNFPFVRRRFLFLGISGALVVTCLFIFFTRGLNFGTDFLGGVKLQYHFANEVSEADIRKTLADLNLGEISIVRLGDPKEKRLAIKVAKTSDDISSLSKTITPKLTEAFGEANVTLEMEVTVGPKVGSELQRKGTLAVLFSLLCMLIYIGFRLDFYFAPGAIVALFHDVSIPLGIFALLQIEFDLTTLAAFLTIVGYSINDSIIVFDRIREHARLITDNTLEEVVERSINETLSRTILTSLTVFFVVVVLYFFGGATIKGFAFAMMLGVILGTVSTFSVVCPIYIWLYRFIPKMQARFEKK